MSARISVHVTPKSNCDQIAGWRGGELSVKVTAPPEGGKANTAVCKVLGKSLGVPKSSIHVVRGQTARHKQVEVDGVDQGKIYETFGQPEDSLF